MEYEENVLYDDALGEDDISSSEDSSLEEKLDRIEALLNEEISLRENEQLQEEMVTESGVEYSLLNTSSGVDNPNYAQYIYDYLSDSTIKVEVVNTEPTTTTPIKDMPFNIQLEIAGLTIALIALAVAFINKYTPKRR